MQVAELPVVVIATFPVGPGLDPTAVTLTETATGCPVTEGFGNAETIETVPVNLLTVRVKFCVALVPTPLLAVKVIGNEPPTDGVPLRTPAVKVTPDGKVPDSVMVGVGKPVAVGVKVPAVLTVNVVLLALVIAGA